MAMYEPDRIKADLEARFPGWQVWYVRMAPGRGMLWCGRRLPQLQADSPEELAELIKAAER
jgi:hypothetical protein